ncbi:MAG TPA: PUA domain-containing protein [Nitrososphaeraceae archaeon]|jgi:60S ribosome subunit biogenesis protein NIP7|nr:PUA domain-containing protein [Nitrososphaeraceae archaeon]
MFRRANREELTQLRRSFDKWGIFEFMEAQQLMIKEDRTINKKEVLITTKTSKDILNLQIFQPKYAGLAVGELRNKKFLPSLSGAEVIARHSRHFPYVVVNERAEGLVLYGRDILGDSVLEVSKKLGQNKIVIILNQNRESIGIGKTRFSAENIFKKDEVTVYTFFDAGIYLRNQDDR